MQLVVGAVTLGQCHCHPIHQAVKKIYFNVFIGIDKALIPSLDKLKLSGLDWNVSQDIGVSMLKVNPTVYLSGQ